MSKTTATTEIARRIATAQAIGRGDVEKTKRVFANISLHTLKVGDRVEVDGATGIVEELLGATLAVRDEDGNLVHVKSKDASQPYPTSATVPAGYEVRISAETASRDYTAVAIPGTYQIEYTTIGGRPVADPADAYYAQIRLQVLSPERIESSAEFGGVCLATRKVEASTDNHAIRVYDYQVRGKAALGTIALHY